MTTQPINREKRLALLLADGSGDFDFVHAIALEDVLYLEGHVTKYKDKVKAEQLALYVGFRDVRNALHVYPASQAEGLMSHRS